jgi:TatD DNase family protein
LIVGLDRAKPRAAKAIIIHNREATDETVGMIRDSRISGDRFVFHCFTGSTQELDQILNLGAMVSFTGIVTFKTAAPLARDAARVPGDRIMIETDSPYLAPEPHRKVRPNEPKYVADVARFLARARGEDEKAFIARVDANAERFFGLK